MFRRKVTASSPANISVIWSHFRRPPKKTGVASSRNPTLPGAYVSLACERRRPSSKPREVT